MGENVVPINNTTGLPLTRESQDDTVALLEQYLERAKAGDISAVAIATFDWRGDTCTAWAGAGRGVAHGLLSGVAIIQHRIAGFLSGND